MDVLKKQTVPLLLIGIAVLYIFVAGLTSGAGVVASTLFGNLVLIAGFTYLYRYDRKKPDYEEVIDSSIIKQYYGKDITIIYILIVLLWFVGQFVFLWTYKTFGDSTYTNTYANNFSNPSDIVFTLSLIGIVAPIAEELLFRYLLFGRFIFKTGINASIWRYLSLHAVSATLFALVHGTVVHLIIVLTLALLLAMLYYKTNRISYCIYGHLLFNNMSLWLGFLISGYSTMIHNLLISIVFIIIYAVLCISILYFVWSRRKN